jgi:uncharacterized protein (DUF58 family)
MSGEYASAFRGQGMEFDEVREYFPGDDVRAIDWNVTARMGTPYVKVFREERELTMLIMVDVSGSQLFGTARRNKLELAAELAAVLAFLAIQNQDRVGLILFSDHIEHYIPPKKGRAHVWNLVRSVLMHDAKGHQTDMAQAFRYVLDTTKRRTLCFVLSDFWDSGFARSLGQLARRHEVIALLTSDPREHEMIDVGTVSFEDLESGQVLTLDTSRKHMRDLLKARYQRHERQLMELFRRSGIDVASVTTRDAIAKKLVGLLRQRERRGRR